MKEVKEKSDLSRQGREGGGSGKERRSDIDIFIFLLLSFGRRGNLFDELKGILRTEVLWSSSVFETW